MRLALFFIAFFLGLYSGSPVSNTSPIFPILAMSSILAICAISSKRIFNSTTILVSFAFVMFGVIWMTVLPSWPDALQSHSDEISVIGRMSSEPFRTRSGLMLPVRLSQVSWDESDWTRENGTALIKIDSKFNALPGTQLQFTGTIDNDHNKLTEPIILRYRPRAIIDPDPESMPITILAPPEPVARFRNNLKYHLLSHLAWGISNPEDELVAGITFGRKGRRLDGNWSMNFYNSGLSHLIVASGAQVSILFMPLFFLLGRLQVNKTFRWILLISLGLALTGFAQLLGGEPSILRASIMGCVLLLAIGLDRKTTGLATLSAAGFFWLVINPFLIHDASFLLSFSASFGIIYLAPVLFSVLPRPKKYQPTIKTPGNFIHRASSVLISGYRKTVRFIIEIALVTFAAQIGVFPALACTVGRISLSGLIANLFAVPIATIILYLGAFSAVTGFITPALPILINKILEILAGLLMDVAEIASDVPYASVPIEPLPGWFALIWYVLMFLLIESRVWVKSQAKTKPVRESGPVELIST